MGMVGPAARLRRRRWCKWIAQRLPDRGSITIDIDTALDQIYLEAQSGGDRHRVGIRFRATPRLLQF
eukprot:scaffold143215_cov105-Phaeocystis_antarctica.AAC.1